MSKDNNEVTIEVVSPQLTIIHNLVVNYDQPHEHVVRGLHYDPLIDNYSHEKWSGGKSGVRKVELHLVSVGRSSSTLEARSFVQSKNLLPSVPSEIPPLGSIAQDLWDIGIKYVSALDIDDRKLLLIPDIGPRIFSLNCHPRFRGFKMDHIIYRWEPSTFFAGTPK